MSWSASTFGLHLTPVTASDRRRAKETPLHSLLILHEYPYVCNIRLLCSEYGGLMTKPCPKMLIVSAERRWGGKWKAKWIRMNLWCTGWFLRAQWSLHCFFRLSRSALSNVLWVSPARKQYWQQKDERKEETANTVVYVYLYMNLAFSIEICTLSKCSHHLPK